ncbi:cupin domain-containing protein [Gayadomonas joobiniege]|uniref:cupin domain-containing protein n=1 Tax=Gayadomonas joobiniege TaxID=1234606 RepID=UPI00037F91E4|nr:cupin domain-containing protein [Gayadomonas joobiniege]
MLNMDFSQMVSINTNEQNWQSSPKNGVWRKLLAREFKEHGHATSIVKFAPGASFSLHKHPGGEEIFVLDGVFSDHTGDYKAGHYFRNPQGFHHAPFTKSGCLLLVKLHQFAPTDTQHIQQKVELDFARITPQNISIQVLHEFDQEITQIEYWLTGSSQMAPITSFGEEIYVISGCLKDADKTYPAGTWLRTPTALQGPRVALQDTILFKKIGHLGR